jgi:uncharacterized membrane protein
LPDSWFAWQRNIVEDPGKSALTGLILIGGIPVISLLTLVTIVGIPLAIMTMVMYGFIYYLSHLVVGGVIGAWLYRRFKWQENSWIFPLGYFLVCVVTAIPFIGFFTHIAIFAFGLGSIFVRVLAGK